MSVPEAIKAMERSGTVWGDEDGEAWFADGHWSCLEMIWAVWWLERYWDESGLRDIESSFGDGCQFSRYWTAEDPEDEERWIIVDRDHPNAAPKTMLSL